MNRRKFVTGSLAAAALLPRASHAEAPPVDSDISFTTSDAHYQARYQSALDTLAANTVELAGVPGPVPSPVLIEGSEYRGIWLECAPHEGLVYSLIRRDIAHNNHMAFFKLQREDGQIPCNMRSGGIGLSQIQMVVPIAATALELAQQTGDEELLTTAYESCSRWDAWLRKYRDTRKTGLCEGFCIWDTGHDNSPRWAGMPNACPNGDARKCPPNPSLPRLCPDLSATVYGGRMALAAMANALHKPADAEKWETDAGSIRKTILDRLCDPTIACFYDLDAQNKFVRIRGDLLTRVLGEHVVDQQLFDTIYQRQIHNPKSFWAPYPLPSIALDDPTFVRPIPRNSWGGASQALTALRAPRWMEYYNKPADLAHLMQQWVAALLHAPDGIQAFRQQMDPMTGEFTQSGSPGYSPAALAFIDSTWRLAGVRYARNTFEWNIRPGFAGPNAIFRLRVSPIEIAEIRYSGNRAELYINNQLLHRVTGTLRLKTRRDGSIIEQAGIADTQSTAMVESPDGKQEPFRLDPNQVIGFLMRLNR
ncbi:MGH1-like glycoside hydrolase domain-containing protein [Terracidiphilus sp.]|uniref:MGH1-like glycoside hydrolase domain-containing protein n=1 Tax=Terracidiphilus sp. TaxID=1964191 RepID=UPI003C2AABCB